MWLRMIVVLPTIDVDGGRFQMTLVLDNEVHDLSNVTGFIEGEIYVIDRNGLKVVLGV